jgi:hypothetical protein
MALFREMLSPVGSVHATIRKAGPVGFEPTTFGSLHPSGAGARCPILAILTSSLLSPRDLDYGPVARHFPLNMIKLVMGLGAIYAFAIKSSAILPKALIESASIVVNFWPVRLWAPLP